MDPAGANASSIGDFAWHNNRGLSSDEGHRDMNLPQETDHMEIVWDATQRVPQIRGGQLSPASTNIEVPVDDSSAPTMAPSIASSCEESWDPGNVEREEPESDVHWEQGSDDVLTVPKLEPVEDEFSFSNLKGAPTVPSAPDQAANSSQGKQKRPRGRPRKHPLVPASSSNKITKGRSKTGCITCRKRKKKCDEAKPRCMNCEKNAVVCEGYHEKQIWKSGKERAEEEDRMRRESVPGITLHPLFHGVETLEDQIFWKHYINNFSNVLTVEGEARNAFKDIILHLANQHQGLMHSILSVSSKHIDFDTPYGAKLLQDNPNTSRQALEDRSDHHHAEAMKRFHEDIAISVDRDDPEYDTEEYQTLLAARYGQILCRLLQTRAEGNITGEHRLHLQGFKTLMEHSPPQDEAFCAFITEFFQYHIYADDLLWHPDIRSKRLSSDDWEASTPMHSPRLLGVADGLLRYMTIITDLRNTIRENMTGSHDPPVDYVMLFRAAEINSAIQEWSPQSPTGSSRNRLGLLYKQMMFIYLFRTIYPPSASPRSGPGGFGSMRSSTASTPQRRPSVTASIASTASAPVDGTSLGINGSHVTHSCPSSRHPTRNNSMHEGDSHNLYSNPSSHRIPTRHHSMHEGDSQAFYSNPSSRMPTRTNSMHEGDSQTLYSTPFDAPQVPSPAPKRRPVLDDPRLISAVDESLQLLESFGPAEPAQTLLLIPCMLIGIACFDPERRERVRKAIWTVKGYTGLRNCDRVLDLLEEIWTLMNKGQWVAVWDWQAVARRIGIDVPCT